MRKAVLDLQSRENQSVWQALLRVTDYTSITGNGAEWHPRETQNTAVSHLLPSNETATIFCHLIGNISSEILPIVLFSDLFYIEQTQFEYMWWNSDPVYQASTKTFG